MNPSYIANPYNQILAQKHGQLSRAIRYALSTNCDPATGEPKLTRAQMRKQLKTIQVNATAAGDNIIIPALAGIKDIYELVMWNVTAQDLIWQQGTTNSANPDNPFAALPSSLPNTSGFTLGFNGNFEMAHWEIDNGQVLVLNLSAGTQVTGFIRYRVRNGTNWKIGSCRDGIFNLVQPDVARIEYLPATHGIAGNVRRRTHGQWRESVLHRAAYPSPGPITMVSGFQCQSPPPGLTLSPSALTNTGGLISGICTTAGTFTATIQATAEPGPRLRPP